MTNDAPNPAGYRRDSRGNLVLEANIKPIDRLRDETVAELVAKTRAVSKALADLKGVMERDFQAFIDLSLEQYGVKIGGKRGNVTLMSFDGRYKVIRANQDQITFDERLQAAKALIDECMTEWSAGAHQGLISIINDAFRTDRNGELRSAQVLRLRRHNIDDPRWKAAMDAISDALQVHGSKEYFRVYERISNSENYRMIPLDIAGV